MNGRILGTVLRQTFAVKIGSSGEGLTVDSAREIVVVSGLPRSGTSLMMQMLERGGLPILTDEIRSADPDNPRGYYEWEAAKKLKVDSSWVPSARGKVIKVVSQLLYDLPTTEQYRVVFMQRELEEVLASQEKMLERRGNAVAPRNRMRDAFTVHLERLHDWIREQTHLKTLLVSYNAMMSDPESEVDRIVAFLEGRVTRALMLEAIDPDLYRNRN